MGQPIPHADIYQGLPLNCLNSLLLLNLASCKCLDLDFCTSALPSGLVFLQSCQLTNPNSLFEIGNKFLMFLLLIMHLTLSIGYGGVGLLVMEGSKTWLCRKIY